MCFSYALKKALSIHVITSSRISTTTSCKGWNFIHLRLHTECLVRYQKAQVFRFATRFATERISNTTLHHFRSVARIGRPCWDCLQLLGLLFEKRKRSQTGISSDGTFGDSHTIPFPSAAKAPHNSSWVGWERESSPRHEREDSFDRPWSKMVGNRSKPSRSIWN